MPDRHACSPLPTYFSFALPSGAHFCVPLATRTPICATVHLGMTLSQLIVQLCILANVVIDPVFHQVHVPITVDGHTVNATATYRSDDSELELSTTSIEAARRFCRQHDLFRDESGMECENAVGSALLQQLHNKLLAKSSAVAAVEAKATPSTFATDREPNQEPGTGGSKQWGAPEQQVRAHTEVAEETPSGRAHAGSGSSEKRARRWLWFVPRPGGTFNQFDQLWEAAQLAVAFQRTLVLPHIAPSKHTGKSRHTDATPFESLWSLQHMDAALRHAVTATGGASSGCSDHCGGSIGAATNAHFVQDCGGIAHFGGATGFDRFVGARNAKYPAFAGVRLLPVATSADPLSFRCLGLSYGTWATAAVGASGAGAGGKGRQGVVASQTLLVEPRFLTALHRAQLPPFGRSCPNVLDQSGDSVSSAAVAWNAAVAGLQPRAELETIARALLRLARSMQIKNCLHPAPCASHVQVVAAHVRRGDYAAHCAQLARQVGADSLDGCWPTPGEIVRSLQVRCAVLGARKRQNHCRVLIMTNPGAKSALLADLRAVERSRQHIDDSVVRLYFDTLDTLITSMEQCVDHRCGMRHPGSDELRWLSFSVTALTALERLAVEQRLMVLADAFVGNAFSSLSGVTFHQRLLSFESDGSLPDDTGGANVDVWHTWDNAKLKHQINMSACPLWASKRQPVMPS